MASLYLAARYGRRAELQEVAARLRDFGHVITSRWINGGHDLVDDASRAFATASARFAEEDWVDLVAADVFIAFTEAPGAPGRGRGGRHVELGAALALRKTVIVVGPRENIFAFLPQVIWFGTTESLLALAPFIAATPAWTPRSTFRNETVYGCGCSVTEVETTCRAVRRVAGSCPKCVASTAAWAERSV